MFTSYAFLLFGLAVNLYLAFVVNVLHQPMRGQDIAEQLRQYVVPLGLLLVIVVLTVPFFITTESQMDESINLVKLISIIMAVAAVLWVCWVQFIASAFLTWWERRSFGLKQWGARPVDLALGSLNKREGSFMAEHGLYHAVYSKTPIDDWTHEHLRNFLYDSLPGGPGVKEWDPNSCDVACSDQLMRDSEHGFLQQANRDVEGGDSGLAPAVRTPSFQEQFTESRNSCEKWSFDNNAELLRMHFANSWSEKLALANVSGKLLANPELANFKGAGIDVGAATAIKARIDKEVASRRALEAAKQEEKRNSTHAADPDPIERDAPAGKEAVPAEEEAPIFVSVDDWRQSQVEIELVETLSETANQLSELRRRKKAKAVAVELESPPEAGAPGHAGNSGVNSGIAGIG